MTIKTYTADEIKAVIAEHGKWRRDEGGSRADLSYANLSYANLRYADLSRADLSFANLSYTDLSYANLRHADLSYANLSYANLSYANLSYTDLSRANLSRAKLPAFLILPQLGAFIAWKKAGGRIVKLEIPADANRVSSLVGRKCRAEFVRVLDIDGATEVVTDAHGPRTVYRIGEIVRPDKYDDDIRVECSHGIHFFMTREEAQEW